MECRSYNKAKNRVAGSLRPGPDEENDKTTAISQPNPL
jgi:hypothetical protein